MPNPSYVGLINNMALLLVMGALYGSFYRHTDTLLGKTICGVALGAVGVGVMLTPWELAPGIFFDTRAIVLSVGGLFLGVIPTSIAMAMTGFYRLYVGGPGVLTGTLWVVVAGLLGICWGRFHRRPVSQLSGWEYYFFGVVVQGCMLALMLTMPSGLVIPTLSQITLPLLAFFPIGSFLLSKFLADQEKQIQNEMALDKSERKYRELVQHSHAIILRLDKGGRCSFVNDYAQNLFGFSQDEMLGKRLGETILPQSDSAGRDLHTLFESIVNNPEKYPANENENICRDGRRVQVAWKNVPLRDESGAIIGLQSIGHDVTEQRQAEESLRAAERQFHQLIEVSPAPLAIYDLSQTIIYVNNKFVDLFGYSLKDIPSVDAWWSQAYPDPEYRAEVRQRWESAVSRLVAGEEEFQPQEARVSCKDGTVRDTVGMLSFIGGQCVVVLTDLTRERDIDRMKSEFIATAAHELNTPLTTIAGFTEILLNENDFSQEQQKEYLAIVHKKTQVLERIVDDLLNIGRVESGRMIHLELNPCLVREVIASTVVSYQKEFPGRKIELNWPEADDLTLAVDAAKLGQVMENLLSNAVKYSPENGAIHVETLVGGGKLKVSVRDEGIGMTPEQIERIFERFYRVDLSNTAVPGMGLGMAIVKNIIDAHGGKIWVESELGKGAIASFTLPFN